MALRGDRHRIGFTARNRRFQPPRDGPAAAFLHLLTEKHDLVDTEFLVDPAGYLTALSHRGLSGRINYQSETAAKMVSHRYHANQPLPLVLAGQSIQRKMMATQIQTPLQPLTAKSSAPRTNAS
ncbi:Transposase [Halomicrobium sp. LC1Hm]|nr:Transposase [Halomicrobium sp. LC1Hm]